jgi:hypothetical protein
MRTYSVKIDNTPFDMFVDHLGPTGHVVLVGSVCHPDVRGLDSG